ncbi:MAG: thioredoxin fold domain-containing protein [Caldimonas sp.]
MSPNPPLPAKLDAEPGHVTVVLFSQPGCEFCAEVREHYLRPMISAGHQPFTIAEADIQSTAPIRDWDGHDVAQRDFARASGARFAPTVMFFDAHGRSLAEPIVGLSKEFFGAYLEQRLRAATKESKTHRSA